MKPSVVSNGVKMEKNLFHRSNQRNHSTILIGFQFENLNRKAKITQITDGIFDVNGIVGQSGNELVVSRTDMNHAAELYVVNLKMVK